MPFLNKGKTIIISKTDASTHTIKHVFDIGPAEGFDGFICFWRESGEIPFFLIPVSKITCMELLDEEEVASDNS